MKEYDLIAIGTGSAMNIVDAATRKDPHIRVALIDKDEPGGICLTRGCIPSKILLYPAELIRTIEIAGELGISLDLKNVDFAKVIERMRTLTHQDIEAIRNGLVHSKNIDYYPLATEFTSPYTLRIGQDIIRSNMIFLCLGSRPAIPPIRGLEEMGYKTSDTILKMNELPKSLAVIGGGYVAAEYGHFFSTMGSEVTIVGRNPQFLPEEEPEISTLAKRELQKHMNVITNHEVREVRKASTGEKEIVALERNSGKEMEITAEEVLVATGRIANTDILHPERAGIEMDKEGWILVDEYLETTAPNVWAFGDADGKYPFKHVANYEAQVVYYNALLKMRMKVDYHAVPHAVFSYPEIASVGMKEKEALEKYGSDNTLIGIHRYEDTAKGEAMNVKDYFAKVIVEKDNMKILGAHIIGPQASILIQEIVNAMYTHEQNMEPILNAMHIHPALSEVVQRTFDYLMPPEQYHHIIEHHYGLPTS